MSTFAIPIEQPQHIDLTPDRNVVLFIGILILIAGVLPGLWPALSAARVNVLQVLGSQGANTVGARPAPLRRWLVGAQVAGSTMFLAIAALFVQSYSNILDVDLGFAADRIVVAELQPAQQGFDIDASQRYVASVTARVRALPGVAGVAFADRAPFFIGYTRRTTVWPESGTCEGDRCPKYETYAVSSGYFQTMGIALTEGREFAADRSAAEVIVSGAFARAQWPDRPALGQVLRIGASGESVTVVGITGKTRTRGLERETPSLFIPFGREDYERSLTLVTRTAGDPVALVRPVAEAADAIDPNVALLSVKTMEQQMAWQMWPFRTLSLAFLICGGLALVLATVGLAGIVIHSVSRRIREFGVRMSVGATPRDLMRDVLASGIRMLVPGLVAGLVLAAASAKLVQVIFVGVNVLNPVTYLAVAVLQSVIVVLACIGPALRASRVDPILALRAE